MTEPILIAAVAAIATLSGVTIGAALTWLANRSIERQKFRNVEDGKVSEIKRDVYTKYFAAANHVAKQYGKSPDPNGAEVLDLMNALAAIEIFAPSEVYRAIYSHTLVVSDQIFNQNPAFQPDDWGNTRRAAVEVVRRDLGLPTSADA